MRNKRTYDDIDEFELRNEGKEEKSEDERFECEDDEEFGYEEVEIEAKESEEDIETISDELEEGKVFIKHNHCVSKNGIPFDVLKSFLQKSIRMGNVQNALWVAKEITDFHRALLGELDYTVGANVNGVVDPHPERIIAATITNALHRVIVIFLEDVETGSPWMKDFVQENMSKLLEDRKKKISSDSFYLHLSRVLIAMASAPSCGRIYSLVKACYFAKETVPEGWEAVKKIEGLSKIVDVFLDNSKKTKSFTEVSAQLKLPKDHSLKFWMKHSPSKERWLAIASHHVHSILVKLAKKKPTDWKVPDIKLSIRSVPNELRMPFVLDRHTKEGKSSRDKGYSRFALLGSLVHDECHILPPIATKIYVQGKLPTIESKWNLFQIFKEAEVISNVVN